MSVVLRFSQWYRIPTSPFVGVLPFSLCFSGVPSWKCNFIVAVATSSRSRRMDSSFGSSIRERHKQPHELFVSSPSKWLDHSLEQRSFPDPHSRENKTRKLLWSNDLHQYMQVDSQVTTLDDQRQKTEGPYQKSVCASLSSVLHSLCDKGQLDKALQVLLQIDVQGCVPSAAMYGCFLKECAKRKALPYAKLVHAQLVKHGLDSTRFLGEYMVSTLMKCGDLQNAIQIFRKLAYRTVFSWTAVIFGYTKAGHCREALGLYHCMRLEGLEPDSYTFASLLRACGTLCDLNEAKWIHSEACKYSCESHLPVIRSLIDTYGNCGSIVNARNVFDRLAKQDVVSWNFMLAAYVQQGEAENVWHMYERMVEKGVRSNEHTFVCVLQACCILAENEESTGHSVKLESLRNGKVLHADAWGKGYDSDVFVGSALVSFYSKCGSIADAQNVFDGLSKQNVVTWTAMLAAFVQQGKGARVLQQYRQMLEGCISPNDRTFVIAIQACGILAGDESPILVDGVLIKEKSFAKGKALHVQAWRKGYESDVFVRSILISMYGKCGSLGDAQNVFDNSCNRNVVVYNSMLAAYAQHGQTDKIFQLYEKMLGADLAPDFPTFLVVLQACGILADNEAPLVNSQSVKSKALEMGKVMHADAWSMGYDLHVSVGSTLIAMYGKCNSIVDAMEVFNGLSHQCIVPWNALLSAFVRQAQPENALHLYEEMQEQGFSPNNRTMVIVLRAAAMATDQEIGNRQFTRLEPLARGKALHAEAWRKGYDLDIFVGNSLVSMYGKCGDTLDAKYLYDGLVSDDVVSWNAMLVAYAYQGQAENALELYEKQCGQGMSPDIQTFVSVLQACSMIAEKEGGAMVGGMSIKVTALEIGKAIHAASRRKDFLSDIFLGNSLLVMYGKCGSILDAENVFDGLYLQNVVSWNTLLAAYVDLRQAHKALRLYEEMGQEGLCPNDRTFVTVLQACAIIAQEDIFVNGQVSKKGILDKGSALHGIAQDTGDEPNVSFGSAVISMYGKSGSFLNSRDVSCGPVMGIPFVVHRDDEKPLQLYPQMQNVGVSPDGQIFRTLPPKIGAVSDKQDKVVVGGQSCKVKLLQVGRAIQANAWQMGYSSDPYVASTLINLYGKCGSIVDAQKVFAGSSHRNVVTWTSMLAAYAQEGQGEKALKLYQEMQQEGVHPDDATFVCMLQVCSNTGSLSVCRQIHQTAVTSKSILGPFLANTLIHAYGRCASMLDAQIVFDALHERNVMSWTALMAGYAREGNSATSLQLYEEMRLARTKPDAVTFLTLLSACCHVGLVDKGVEYFESMTWDYGINPDVEHYASMVDLLGRAGYFAKIHHLLSTMPREPNLSIWLSLLSACRKHGKVVLGKHAFDYAVLLQPKHSSAYVLMLNVYANAGLWDLANEVKEMQQQRGAWKEPGQSWIEHEDELHRFVVEDNKHPQQALLYDILGDVNTLGVGSFALLQCDKCRNN